MLGRWGRDLAAGLLVAGALAGCGAVTPPPDTARVPPGAFGAFEDADIAAINVAQYAWADPPRRVGGNPVDGARAVAAVDFLAGELSFSPRWDQMNPLTKIQMLQARDALRRLLGVPPGIRSQRLVDTLLSAANALAAGDRDAALTILGPPVFATPAPQTLAILSALPYVPIANYATQHAAGQEFPNDGGGGFQR